MPFVNLNKRITNNKSYRAHKKSNSKKMLFKLLLFIFILFIAVYLPLRGVYQSTKQIIASVRAINFSLKQENLDEIRNNLRQMKKANDNLSTSLSFLFWARFIPFFGGFYLDATHFSKAAGFELNAATTLADSLDPYKNELGFNGHPTPGQDRVAQFVAVLSKIMPQLDKIQPNLQDASQAISSIDVDKYPEKIGKFALRRKVETAKNFIQGAAFAVKEARDALEVVPQALGQPDAKNYLLIFQNDKELRATGGFMTAYAFLKLDKGRVSSSTSDDIYRLDEKLLKVCQVKICPLSPPAPLVKYLPEANGKPRTAWSMRDSNLSPDLPSSMKEFERMYQLLGEGTNFDGIIMIDTKVVEELIKITGPIEVFETKYSAEIDKRCSCPNVIYELENYAQIIEKGEQDRKAILGTLMQQILARSLGSSTDKLPDFISAGVELAGSKHIMFYMHDSKTQTALSKLNWTGEIRNSSGDYLHINDSNFAGGKSNLYVEEEVLLEIDAKNIDKVKHKLTINYKNSKPYTHWLNQRNRDYLRIYVPKGSKLISSNGSDVAVTTIEEELGKTVFEAFIEVRPQNSRTITFEYETPLTVKDKQLPLLVQKQPGTKDHKYEVKINGKKKADFKLDSDKDLKLEF